MATKTTTFSESKLNITSNTSSLTINIYFSAQNQSTYFYNKTLYCTCDGNQKSATVSHAVGGSVSASFTFDNIPHNSDGTRSVGWSWSCATGTSALGTIGDSGTKQLSTIQRYAKTNSVEGTNIEGQFKVNFTKYVSSWQYKLRISIPQVEELDRIDYNTSGQEFTLSQKAINELFRYTNQIEKNDVKLGFAVETWDGNTKKSAGNEIIITGKVVNADPIFSNFTFEDINPTTLALTGDSSVNVDGYSNIQATISVANKAEPQKGATMTKYRFECGTNQPVEEYYSNNSDVVLTMNNATSSHYKIYARDKRGNSTPVDKFASREVLYTPISFISSNCKVERNNGGVGGYAVLTLSGNIWEDYFDESQQNANSITNISYQYKKTSEGESAWQTGPTTIVPTISGNTFSFTGQILSNETDNEFELNSSYNFRIFIQDELSTAIIELTPMASAIPNISLADKGVGVMCDYDESLGGDLQVGGKIVDGLIRYSIEEHMIGYYKDKPLYEKIIEENMASNQTAKNTNLNLSNIDKFILVDVRRIIAGDYNQNASTGSYYYASDDYFNWYLATPNSKVLNVRGGSNWPKRPYDYIIILQYTKTTD